MHRAWLALAVLACSVARGQAPSYSAAGVVNAIGYGPGPFAPNAVVSIFGTSLCLDSGAFLATSTSILPTTLDYVTVFVDGRPAPLLMVSPTQINFLIPSDEVPGTAQMAVSRQGISGPVVTVTLNAIAPTLFPLATPSGYLIAEDWNANYALVTPDAPAHAGDIVVIFATGLGALQVPVDPTQIPSLATQIANLSSLSVLVNGAAVDPTLVKYAGVTPGYAGLYQINLLLPGNVGTDPTIQISLAGQVSQGNLKLPVR